MTTVPPRFRRQLQKRVDNFRRVLLWILFCLTAVWIAAGAQPIVITSSPALCPPAVAVGTAYSGCSFTATGGSAPYTWSLTNNTTVPPPGMTLYVPTTTGTATVQLAGTPTTTGNYKFNVHAAGGGVTGDFPVSISVRPKSAGTSQGSLTITTTTLAPGEVNSYYSATVAASGGTLPYYWSFNGNPSSALSDMYWYGNGDNTASFYGYPYGSGSPLYVPVLVTDSSSPTPLTATASIPWTVYPQIVVTPSGQLTPTILTNTFGSFTFQASGGNGGPYTWTEEYGGLGDSLRPGKVPLPDSLGSLLRSSPPGLGGNPALAIAPRQTALPPRNAALRPPTAANRPPIKGASTPAIGKKKTSQLGYCYPIPPFGQTTLGMDLVTTTGSSVVFSGTPTSPCYYDIGIAASDGVGSTLDAVTVAVADPVTITDTSLPPGEVGVPYSYQFSAAGGDNPSVWSLTDSGAGLSGSGLSLSSDGVLSGTPTATGTYSVALSVSDPNTGLSGSTTLPVTIYAPLSITTVSLPYAPVNKSYSYQLAATGGSGSYTWSAQSLSGGALSAWFSISSSGLITGTPTLTGITTFYLTVSDTTANQAVTTLFSLAALYPSSISLITSGSPANYGSAVTLTATVTGGSAGDKVTFYDGTNVLGTSALTGSTTLTASLTTHLLGSGSHLLKAYYLGNAITSIAPATSSAVTQVVNTLPQAGFGSASSYPVGSQPSSVAAGDFNGDGKIDLVTANFSSGNLSVLLGNGDGTFQTASTFASISSAYQVLVGDFNVDGKQDLAVLSPSAGIYLLLGNGDGTFQTASQVSSVPSPAFMVQADFNQDGIPDLAFTSNSSQTPSIGILLGNGDGTFIQSALSTSLITPSQIVAGDFNGDGIPDLAVSDVETGTINVLLGNGNGTFQAPLTPTGNGSTFMTAADLNGDGKLDLVTITSSGAVQVIYGNGDGTFQTPVPYTVGIAPNILTVVDVNSDGRPDLVIVDYASQAVDLLLGQSNGTFSLSSSTVRLATTSPWSILAADVNADGRPDLVTAFFNASGTVGVNLGAIPQPSLSCPFAPPIIKGTAYSTSCVMSGGYGTPTFVLIGTLPTGLTLNSSTGVVSGNPTTAGNYPFAIQVTDSDTPPQSTEQAFNVTVYNPISITTSSLPAGINGAAYTSTQFTASGGTTSYKWTATGLPPGLTLSTGGVLSGTPTTTGTYSSISITATDATYSSIATTATYSVTVYNPITITTSSLHPGDLGSIYSSVTLAASGGSSSYTWSATGLPTGLSLSGAGVLSGTPTATGTFSNVQITASDTVVTGLSRSSTFTITINGALSISNSSLPNGVTNSAYTSTTLTATGGSGSYSWSATGLPPGLTLSPAGVLSGTPTVSGTFASVAITLTDTVSGASLGRNYSLVIYVPLTITTVTLPSGSPGQTYPTTTLTAAGGSGVYSWSATGLPTGLTLSAAGVLSGSTTASGTFTARVTVTDSTAGLSAQQTYTVTVYNPLSITTSSLPAGILNSAYTRTTLAVSGGSGGNITWTATGIPPGLTVSSAGVVSGTPTAVGTYANFSVTATDATANLTAQQTYSVTISYPSLLITSNAALGGVALGNTLTATLTAAGGKAPYTWSTVGTVPAGVNLNPTTGVITATPVTFGTFSFKVQVADSQSVPFTTQQTVSFTVLAITSGSVLPVGTTGSAYSFIFTAQGGATSTYKWTVVSSSAGSVPPGLTLTTAGVLQGTPTQASTFVFSVQADDGVSPAIQSVTITIYSPITILTPSLPDGQTNVSYGPVSLFAIGGSGSYTWSASGLPSGLVMSPSGVISGTPLVAGSYSPVNVTVGDTTAHLVASKSLSMNVSAVVQISGAANLTPVALGSPITGSFSASGGRAPYTWAASGLPAGTSVDPNSGTVSGTPATAGVFSFVLQATDSTGITGSLTVNFSVLGISTTTLPPATAGQTYSQSITAIGGTTPYSFSGSGLPPGLTLASSGAVAGRPSTAGAYSMSVRVTDANGLTVSATVSITVSPAPPLKISSVSLPDSTVAQPYSQGLVANGGLPPYSWALTGGVLPAGLSLNQTGIVSGVPTAVGNYAFGVQVTDSVGATVVGAVTLNVKASPLQITTALPSGVANTDYPLQILNVTGGVAPYTYSIQGALPAGLSLSSGTISGTPTTPGTSNFTIVVADSAGNTSSVPAAITIRPAKADLILSSSAVSFALSTGAVGLPSPVSVTVRSSDITQVLNYSVSYTSAPWLSVTTGSSTPNNLAISLSSQALALAGSTTPYTSTITITCQAPSPCAGNAQTVTVSLLVSSPPPQLGVDTSLLSFTASAANPVSASQNIGIQNIGGGTLNIVSITAADSWVSIGTFAPTLPAGPAVPLTITANPAGLQPGYYRSTVTISVSAPGTSPGSPPVTSTTAVVVTLLISSGSTMTLGPAGAQFSMSAGGAVGNPNGSFLVAVSTSSPVNWSAAVLPGASWLIVNTPTGTSVGSAPGTATYSIDPAASGALAPGAYYGTIRIAASGIVNTPQDYQVILSVSPANSAVLPDPEPAGLIFLTNGTTSLPPQTVQLFASSKTPVQYQASVSTVTGGNWLSVTPATGTSAAGAPAQSTVSVNAAGLGQGVYRGGISYAFSASAVRTVNVTLIVQPALSAAAGAPNSPATDRISRITAAGCTPSQLVPTQTGLVSNFSAPASWPTPLAITLVDDCGNSIAGGQIVATFSNGDPPQVLALVDGNTGLYSATWTPRKTASQITIAAKATAAGFPAATAQITGQVTPNVAPAITPHGTLHVFNPQVGGSLGPGNIVQIYGTGLAGSTISSSTVPLPTTLGGTSVIIGGIQSPLFFVSGGQVNAQIPFELTPGQQYQVIISANGALTTPDSIQLTAVAPGIAAFTTGEVIAQHADGSLVSDSSPAKPGEYIVFYLAGLGDTNNPVATGAASPSSPLATPLSAATLTIGGEQVDILFAGLTPGLVGLYQVNAQVPADAQNGLLPLVITQAGTASNSTLLPVHQ